MPASDCQTIWLYNRKTEKLEEERLYKAGIMVWLYRGWLGHLVVIWIVKWRWFSRFYTWLQNLNRSHFSVQQFVKAHQINVDELELPLESYPDFNAFFIRKFKTGARPVPADPRILIAPADSRLKIIPLHEDRLIPVKGRSFTLTELLGDAELAEEFRNGLCLSFRLAPEDYHRFIYFDEGMQHPVVRINGLLHSVSPLSLRRMYSVFTENVREVSVLDTDHFGKVVEVDVGALTVGRIEQHFPQGTEVYRGQEKGYFQLGGSSILLLFQPKRIWIDDDIWKYSTKDIETRVQLGEGIGCRYDSVKALKGSSNQEYKQRDSLKV